MFNTDLPTRAELPSSARLLRSTALAAAVAALLLVTTVLPAEYGIDPTGIGAALGLKRMGEIKTSLAQEADAAASAKPVSADPTRAAAASGEAPAKVDPVRQHTVNIVLAPGQAAEIKLSMFEGATVRYKWQASGGAVNYDTHGDPDGAPKDFYHGYGKGRNETGDAGTLTAAFDGIHGWYWRNSSTEEVTLTLETDGAYGMIERVM